VSLLVSSSYSESDGSSPIPNQDSISVFSLCVRFEWKMCLNILDLLVKLLNGLLLFSYI
jgi:hypothetical protein